MRFAATALTLTLLAVGGWAQNPPSVTMTYSYKEFPTNAPLEFLGAIPVALGPTITLSAPNQVSFQNASGQNIQYSFLFWDIPTGLSNAPAVTFSAPPTNFNATAWYQAVGGPGGGGQPTVTTYAFSTGQDKVLPDNPLQSANPASACTAATCSTAGSTPVVITAKSSVPSATGEVFVGWLPLPPSVGTHGLNRTLTLSQGKSGLAIASYGVDPCASIADQIDYLESIINELPKNIQPGVLRQIALLRREYLNCRKQHGL